jgi:hypothetical protein
MFSAKMKSKWGPEGNFGNSSDSIDSGFDNGVEIVAVGGEGILDVENNTGRSTSVSMDPAI